MRIHITGDTHGERERFEYFKNNFDEASWNAEDLLIVCGDFGYLFFDNQAENLFLDELAKKPYTICFIDGNHENFTAIYSYPEVDFCGGRAHKIRENIFHLMRGYVFDIGGNTFFAMGGAYSIDKPMRAEFISWWKEEQPTNEEYNRASENLEAAGNKVDYILTHTMPERMVIRKCHNVIPEDRQLTGFLEWVYENVEFNHWYSGHFHDDIDFDEDFSLLYFDVKTIEI